MTTIAKVRNFIAKELVQNESLELDDDVALIEKGYLTSLQTVELVVFLEERFGVQIEPEEVNEVDFRSLRSIAAMLERKLP